MSNTKMPSKPMFHIFDHQVKRLGGHHYMQLAVLKELCRDNGFDAQVYTSKNFSFSSTVKLDEAESLPTKGLFRETLSEDYAKSAYQVEVGLRNHDYYTSLAQLDISEFQEHDILYFTSINTFVLAGLGRWLRENATLKCHVVIAMGHCFELYDSHARVFSRKGIRLSKESFSALDDERITNEEKSAIYRYFFDSLSGGLEEKTRIFYHGFLINSYLKSLCKENSIKFYRLFSHIPLQVDTLRKSLDKENITVGFLGCGGVESNVYDQKGGRFIEAISREVLKNHPNIHIVIQPPDEKFVDGLSQTDIESDRLYILDRELSAADYMQALVDIDILILPYGKVYSRYTSGILHDAVYMGNVAVVPDYLLDAEWLEALGIDYPSFSRWEANDILLSVDRAVKNYRYYSKQIEKAKEVSRSHWQAFNPISVCRDESVRENSRDCIAVNS